MMSTKSSGASGQIGASAWVSDSIALVIGKDPIHVMCTLEMGKSPLLWGTLSWVPADYTNAFDQIADREERIRARHHDALKADRHPLHTILFHPERLAV